MSDDNDKKKKSAILNLYDMDLDTAIAAINKKYGANTVLLASNATAASIVSRIPTGISALDFALGGGWPEGRIIELHGPFSSFKSTTSLVAIRAFQKKYPEHGMGMYIDLERTFDTRHAALLGVNLKRLLLVNPDSGEQAVNAANDLITLNMPLFVVLDSLAALVPTAEIEASIDQNQMGVQARLVNRMLRVLTARMKRDLYDTSADMVTLMVLNQLRMKLGVMFGNPETTPGGMGKDFFYSVVVRMAARHSKAIVRDITRNTIKREVQFGQTVGFKVVKNKCGGPQHQVGEFIFYERDWDGNKAYTFNNDAALFDYGAFCGIIEFIPKIGFSYEGVSGKNERKFIAAIRKKPLHQASLRKKIVAAMKDPSLFDLTEDEK